MGDLVHSVTVKGEDDITATATVRDPRADDIDFDSRHTLSHYIEDSTIKDQGTAQRIADAFVTHVGDQIAREPLRDDIVLQLRWLTALRQGITEPPS